LRGKTLAWDVTVPDTYADAHVSNTAMETGAAASLAATNKTNQYSQLSATHIFTPVAIETASTWQCTTSQLSWFRNWEGGRPSSQERPPTCSSSYQWLCKRGTRSNFRTCSQPALLLQPVRPIYLTSIFSAYGFVLAFQNIITMKKMIEQGEVIMKFRWKVSK